jgi:hypothetical protein
MMVTGGLTWWKDFICVACFNMLDQRDEVFSQSFNIVYFFNCILLLVCLPEF